MYLRNGVTTTEVAVTPPTSPQLGEEIGIEKPLSASAKNLLLAKIQAAFFLKNLVDFLEAWGVLLAASASSAKSHFQKKSVAEVKFEVAGTPARILPRGNN